VGEKEVVFSAQGCPFGVSFADYAHCVEGKRRDLAGSFGIEGWRCSRERGGRGGMSRVVRTAFERVVDSNA
jgi:hypothetical protein